MITEPQDRSRSPWTTANTIFSCSHCKKSKCILSPDCWTTFPWTSNFVFLGNLHAWSKM